MIHYSYRPKGRGELTIFNKKLLTVFFLLFFTQSLVAKTDNYLRSTALTNNQLKLKFKYNIESVKYFVLKKNGITKHIYDIKKGVLSKGKNISQFRHKNVRAFRIGQYRKNYVRIVIESTYSKKFKYVKHGKELRIVLLNTSVKKNVSKKKKIVKKKKKFPKKKKKYSKKTRKYTTIVIDAGHGGKDNGASSKGKREKHITLAIALKLQRKLKSLGYRVYMTRTKDKFISLRGRTNFANAKGAKLFISIHANAAPRHKRKSKYQGVEVFHLSLSHSTRLRRKRAYSRRVYRRMTNSWKIRQSRSCCKNIKREILKSVRRKHKVVDKGVRKSDFWVLLGTQMPSVLIETGYITHRKEGRKLFNAKYQNLLVSGIANGVDDYFGF